MKEIKVRYAAIPSPPKGIVATRTYTAGKDSQGYYVKFLEEKTYFDLEVIKMLFEPIDVSNWDKVLTVKVSDGQKIVESKVKKE